MFVFDWPWAFCFLPFPLLIRRLPPAQRNTRVALRIPFFKAVAREKSFSTPSHPLSQRAILAYLAWGFLVLAAAGPQWLGQPYALPRAGRDVMLALDISGSMQIPDMSVYGMPTTRLEVVKKVAKDFVSHRVGDRLGLIVFGSKAYVQTPLTFDRETISNMIEDATVGLAGQQTAIGDALGLALKRLQNVDNKSRVIVLITDGGNNSGALPPLQAAKLAMEEGIRIYTMGIGSDAMWVPGPLGNQVLNPSADLDEKTLQTAAKMTGGLFFRAKDLSGLRQAYRMLDSVEPVESDHAVFRPITELYPWPLSFALAIALYLMLMHVIRGRHVTH